ncbi:hypothetical protein EDE12_106145 [Methylosinus sp. sav-2]|uniref:HK97 gp10 family phage protein n=1 Tax=Methylosinus sp. sav-2 TaxID=2485168 RepID=UPI00047AB806|nr:HK97 gp10 family phage protein [Methylosinus sp. sav-2]TDX64000.1 hypothetical protein EDE12_106145 [Methylosinus sp. sav-2]
MLGSLLVGQAAFSLGSGAVDFADPQTGSGLFGWPDALGSLARIVTRMEVKQHRRDSEALAQMIETARGLVPVDSGRLLSGIGGEAFDAYCEFRASAVHETASGKEGADYARFVEFGTRSGEASVAAPITAHEGFYASDQAGVTGMRGNAIVRNRRSRRTHGGTAAQPFFFPAANEVLAKRESVAEALPYEEASAEGWEIGA